MRGGDLTHRIVIDEEGVSRPVDETDLPLSLGGSGSDIPTPGGAGGGEGDGPDAYIGADGGDIFIQPAEGSGRARCNGDILTTSQWLRDGDVITLGETRIVIAVRADRIRLKIERDVSRRTSAPVLTPPPRPPSGEHAPAEQVLIEPAEFTPRSLGHSRRGRSAMRHALLLTWLGLTLLATAAWFTFTARTVELRIDPEPDRVEIRGTLLQLELGGRRLLRPGTYTVVVEKEGFRRLEAPLEVSTQAHQVHELRLERLPGLLTLTTVPIEGVAVAIDGQRVGTSPLDPLELAPGEHTIDATAERHGSTSASVSIEGAGSTTEMELVLQPLWAPVSFDSTPRGALVRVDEESVGRTPVTADLLEGSRGFEMRLNGYKPYRGTLRVVAGEPLSPRPPVLEPVEGWLVLTTEPTGATISIDGEYRGTTPLELELAPGVEHSVDASIRGHRTLNEAVRLESGRTQELHLELEAELGEVEIVAVPPDAELLIDGASRGAARQTVQLTAVPHEIEVRKPGYETVRRQVTPRPGFPQTIEVELETEQEAREQAAEAARPSIAHSPQGQEMRLIGPGRFRMGASRREPGRRANETLREVEITRSFYLATEEVSNKEFREFASSHRAGAAGGFSLDLDDYPVVDVSWKEAARYCNWLSAQQSLEPFYIERNGTLVARQPASNGYRLPTEAEWAWAARYEGGGEARKYSWGSSLPVAPGAGNYADASANGLLPATVSGYDDSYPTTAPVDSFQPNALGIFNLGGNAAEWVHDHYSIYSSASSAVEQDPAGPEEGEYHVIRGSSWMDSTITELRLSYRDYANKARSDVGFRIARYADPP